MKRCLRQTIRKVAKDPMLMIAMVKEVKTNWGRLREVEVVGRENERLRS